MRVTLSRAVPSSSVIAHARQFQSGTWATYRQWQEKGAQVRKGEKSAMVFSWKNLTENQKGTRQEGDERDARCAGELSQSLERPIMARRLKVYLPEADDLLALEPAELAGLILRILVNEQPPHNEGNFINGLRQMDEVYPRNLVPAVSQAIAEAWAWLRAQCLVATDHSQHGGSWSFVTRLGQSAASGAAFTEFRKASLLPRTLLHTSIAEDSWGNFIRGRYDTAVFEAFRAVEIAVREAAGFPQGDHGVPMIRRAFHKDNGPLTIQGDEEAEREAISSLFAGAIGSYKNPRSHRVTCSPFLLQS
jgi:uncharacterized protein (TIGR02391 family)